MANRIVRHSDHLFEFKDTCNVFVIVEGDTGLIIDSGSGEIVDHLADIGVKRIEWVVHTHHHRDQCSGTLQLRKLGARVAVPEYERQLFDEVEMFWQTRRVYGNYDDRNNFFTVGQNIPVDEILEDYETFEWRGFSFYCSASLIRYLIESVVGAGDFGQDVFQIGGPSQRLGSSLCVSMNA
jgi:glyoxylase-like metal-dependent hydrolase (beta-lactamase superfamily II)